MIAPVCLVLFALNAFAQTTVPQTSKDDKIEKSEKMKQRLEQLFIWRVSDRLQLTPQEETKFTEEFKKLSDERQKLAVQLDSLLDQIDKQKDDSQKSAKLLADYQSTLKKYNQCQSREIEVMGRLFGTKKMVQYVLLKREMTQKVKDVLTQNSPPKSVVEKATLKEPEVYQER